MMLCLYYRRVLRTLLIKDGTALVLCLLMKGIQLIAACLLAAYGALAHLFG